MSGSGRGGPRTTLTLRGTLDSRWYPIALILLAAVLAVAMKQFVYPNLSWNRDEPVYLWQADLLLDGQLTQTDRGFAEVFHPWLSAHSDGRFFSQYPLAWPALIAVGKFVGFTALAPAVGAALAVAGAWALTLELTGRRRRASATATLFVLSPILAVQSGVFLTYLFATGLGTLAAAAALRGLRTGSKRLLAASGLLLGLLFLTRPFDTVIWGATLAGFVLVGDRIRFRELLRQAPWFLATFLPLVVVQLVHNRWTTGSATTFAMTVADPLDTFGFGPRRMMPSLEPYDHTPMGALRDTAKHLFFLPWFLIGAHLGGAIALLGAWVGRHERSVRRLLVLAIVFPLAHLPFWGIHVSSLTTRISGPIYYLPVYVPLCALMVEGLVHLRNRRPRLSGIAVVLAIAISVPIGIGRLGLNRHLSRIQGVWDPATKELDRPALAVVSPSAHPLFLDPFAVNDLDDPGELLHATDEDPSLLALLDAEASRSPVLLTPSLPASQLAPSERTPAYSIRTEPITITSGPTIRLGLVLVPDRDGALQIEFRTTSSTRTVGPVTARSGVPLDLQATVALDQDADAGSGDVLVDPAGDRVDIVFRWDDDPVPFLRHRLLADGADGVRLLRPGRFDRADEIAAAKGELIWLDDVDRGDLTITLVPGP